MLYFDSALTGLTLAGVFIVYTVSSIASIFVVTGGMLGAITLYSYATKQDLSNFGNHAIHGAHRYRAILVGEYLAEKHRVDVDNGLYRRAVLRGN